MIDSYKIEGCINLDEHTCFKNVNTMPNFQEKLKEFKENLVRLVNTEQAKSFYKFGDGDYYFLKKTALGSATPGKRALSRGYSDIKHEEFVQGAELCDHYTCELYPENRDRFNQVISKPIDYPAEFGYGLVANKWLTKTFSKEIGVVGAKQKIDLIKAMMNHKEYQDYLGLEKFQDYIHIPQRFACDDIDETERLVAEQLKNSKSKIFLLGIGHVKSALLHRLKAYKKAVFLDVGSGIDALAGVIDHGRPYMGDWVNHRIREFDYSSLDILQYDIWNTPHKLIGE